MIVQEKLYWRKNGEKERRTAREERKLKYFSQIIFNDEIQNPSRSKSRDNVQTHVIHLFAAELTYLLFFGMHYRYYKEKKELQKDLDTNIN